MKKFEYRLKRKAAGVGLLITGWFFISLAVVAGLISMFFALAHMNDFVTPTLITGGVVVLIAILVGIQGKNLLK